MEKAIEVIELTKTFTKYISNKLFFFKKYELINALENISFSINEGESVALVGKNGSGKTTLLKILAGILKPTKGTVKVNKTINVLLDTHSCIHKDLTGYDNILISGKTLGLSTKEIKSKIDEIVDFAEIKDFLYTPVKHYSNGMISRLSFSVTILSKADILLFDEVLAFGDIQFQQKVFKHLKNLSTNGKTLFFVSHDIRQLITLCNRFILLDKGKIIADGTPIKVIHKYFDYLIKNIDYLCNDAKLNLHFKNIISIENIKYQITNENLIIQLQINKFNIQINNLDIGLIIRDISNILITTISLLKNNIELSNKTNETISFIINNEYFNTNYILIFPYILNTITKEYVTTQTPLLVKIKDTNITDNLAELYSFFGMINIPTKIEIN